MAREAKAGAECLGGHPAAGGAGAEGKMMSVDGLRELDEMATKLQATAHKLTQSPKRDELLRDIEELRVQITLRISAHKSENKNGKHGRTP